MNLRKITASVLLTGWIGLLCLGSVGSSGPPSNSDTLQLWVSGYLKDADGCPIGGAVLRFETPSGVFLGDATTYPTGYYEFSPVLAESEGSTVHVTYAGGSEYLQPYDLWTAPRVFKATGTFTEVALVQWPENPPEWYTVTWLFAQQDLEASYVQAPWWDLNDIHDSVERHLIDVHNPSYIFDVGETQYPRSAAEWLGESTTLMYHHTLFNQKHTVTPHGAGLENYVGSLGNFTHDHWWTSKKYSDQNKNFYLDNLGYWKNKPTGPEGASGPIYARVFTDVGENLHPNERAYRIAYTRWHHYNPHPRFPDHEGDLERNTIFVKRGWITHLDFSKHGFWHADDPYVEQFGAKFHFRGETIGYEGFRTIAFPGDFELAQSSRPQRGRIYVAAGSHASYRYAGKTVYRVKTNDGWIFKGLLDYVADVIIGGGVDRHEGAGAEVTFPVSHVTWYPYTTGIHRDLQNFTGAWGRDRTFLFLGFVLVDGPAGLGRPKGGE